MTRVAVIGVGRMGRPMAAHLSDAGFDLGVFDVSAEAASALSAELGARHLSSATDFSDTEVVVTMLPTSAIVAEALLGTGIAEALPEDARIVDMSSSNPAETLATARRVAELGAVLVDAPVSGGVAGAVEATLTIMLGGDDVETAPVLPVLEALSSRIVRTGPVGSGHAMKALNNIVAGATTLACFEAFAAGSAYGLSESTMVDVWNHSTARSFVTEKVMAEHVVTGRFDTGFALPLYAKDVGVAKALADSAEVPAPIISAVAGEFSEALAQLGDVDHTRIFDLRSSTSRPRLDSPVKGQTHE